ncbi:MAG: hypothetical protein SGJ09_05085 [Phycisphaerae bacterium]|nr:hypothetical protein [Phycisphaerae bacterium]
MRYPKQHLSLTRSGRNSPPGLGRPGRFAGRFGRFVGRFGAAGAALLSCLALGGCFVPGLIGALGNEAERHKKIEVLAQYEGLENRSVAVVVHADASTLYEYPTAGAMIAGNVAFRIQSNVKGVSVLAPATVIQWQYQTPAWTTLPYGQVADELGVERVVFIDIYEFRLNPPGNQYVWDGLAAATVGIIERDGTDRDTFAESFDVKAAFPTTEDPLPRESISEANMQNGMMAKFVQECAWLFHTHIEDKYPDK